MCKPGGKVAFDVVVAVGAVFSGGAGGGVLAVWVEWFVAVVLVLAVGVVASVVAVGVVGCAEAGADGRWPGRGRSLHHAQGAARSRQASALQCVIKGRRV